MTDDPLADEPFSYREGKEAITFLHNGRAVKTIKGVQATKFLNRVEGASAHEAQLLMARITGQFKFGNERESKSKGRGR